MTARSTLVEVLMFVNEEAQADVDWDVVLRVVRHSAGPGAGYGARSLSQSRTVWATSRQP
jgi:hypothetical protein